MTKSPSNHSNCELFPNGARLDGAQGVLSKSEALSIDSETKSLSNRYKSASAEETHALGKRLAAELSTSNVLALRGDLGSGKTTFIRGLADALGVDDLKMVCSPTFSFLNIYPGRMTLYHFDLYRLNSAEEFFRAGFDEYFQKDGICCFEWAEKIQAYLPPSTLFLDFSYTGVHSREITTEWPCS